VVTAYDRLQHRLAPLHATDLLDLNMTLPQLKTLYVAAAAGPMRMGDLASRLGTALSTTSEVVDRLVHLGVLERIVDPADRRQVLVQATDDARMQLDNINELSRERLRELLAEVPTPRELATIERAIGLLSAAVARRHPAEEEPE
jgi:DNA-binding MarR family transcriptional regulator